MFLSSKIIYRNHFFQYIVSRMSTHSEYTLLQAAKSLLPSLDTTKHKGQDGRIGIVGGSLEYSGAPYFAGMSALRTGADLVHIFCCREASTPIKSFSPELIVHPILNEDTALKEIEPWLSRLHVILIGPGLGRDNKVLQTVSELITLCRSLLKPLIIDADGLFLVNQNPNLIKNYPGLVLTPNAVEFARLVDAFLHRTIPSTSAVENTVIKELAEAIGERAIVLRKGSADVIADGRPGTTTMSCSTAGSGRRCGGQGDLLSGSLSALTCWATRCTDDHPDQSPRMLACYAACRLVRECNAAAFASRHRGTLASDMLHEIAPVFHRLLEP